MNEAELLPELLHQFPLGLALSILVETVVLITGLSLEHRMQHRLFAGVALTLCSYPVIALGLPMLMLLGQPRSTYLWVGETTAALIELLVFTLAFEVKSPQHRVRNLTVVFFANMASFAIGEVVLHG